SDGERRPYGGPALLVDGLAMVGVAGGETHSMQKLVVASLATYALSGPVNHILNGHAERAPISLLMRTLAVGIGASGVAEFASCVDQGNDCRSSGPFLAMAAGVSAALALTFVDDIGWSYDVRPRKPPRATVAPSVVVGSNASVVGLTGTF